MGNSPSSQRAPSNGQFDDFTNDQDYKLGAGGLPRRTSSQQLGHSRTLSNPASNSSAAASHRRARSANVPSSHGSRHLSSAPPPYSPIPEAPPVTPPKEAQVRRSNVRSMSTRNAEYLHAPMRQESKENALETLRKYDTVVIVDDSRSMAGALWNEARDALAALAEVAAQYDSDGIDVYFLNYKRPGRGLTNAVAVKRLFDHVRPRGATPIGATLEDLLLEYIGELEKAKERRDAGDIYALKQIKPVNYILITDGAPTDDPESVIVAAARRLDAQNFPLTQVGIQFVQIGTSKRATEFLKELDDGLSANFGIRDIVDTTPYTGNALNAEMLLKILLGGINRRVDRRGAAAVMDE